MAHKAIPHHVTRAAKEAVASLILSNLEFEDSQLWNQVETFDEAERKMFATAVQRIRYRILR